MRPSVAFSTLGWFDDPLLSSWMRADQVRIAELLIHELLHRTFYVLGQTEFNESLATFVGHRGAIEFFRARDGSEADTTRGAVAGWEDALAESRLWTRAVVDLDRLYDEGERDGRSLDDVLAARAKIFGALEKGDADVDAGLPNGGLSAAGTAAATPGGGNAVQGEANFRPRRMWHRIPTPLNNAVILANYAYLKDLAAFESIYASAQGDLRAAIARVRQITEGPRIPLRRSLRRPVRRPHRAENGVAPDAP